MIIAFLLLATSVSAVASVVAAWQAWRARVASEASRPEIRAARLQLGNVLDMLTAAGFKKPKRVGWEDDWHKTQLKDSVPEASACRQRGDH
jgi:hypothetical protein